MSAMHEVLRQATSASHETLDALLGSLDLGTRAGYVRFLQTHYVGLLPLAPVFTGFVEGALAMPAPDYPALLQQDLHDLGIKADSLPRLEVRPVNDPAGVAYVLAGSRLGVAMLRRQPVWGHAEGLAGRYMDDAQGLAIWRALVAWMKVQKPSSQQEAHAAASADIAFAMFARAFEVTAQELC